MPFTRKQTPDCILISFSGTIPNEFRSSVARPVHVATRGRQLPSPSMTTDGVLSTSTSAETLPRSAPKSPTPELLSFDDLPEWYQDNPHIRRGYRPVSGSAASSIASWRRIHNETVNIYSHLVPGAAFLLGEWYILHYLHARHGAEAVAADYLVLAVYLVTAAGCLGLSAAYHTLINHSHAVERVWLRLDLVGIVLLTAGILVSGTYVVFWCEPLLRGIYWAMVGLTAPLPGFLPSFCISYSASYLLPLTDIPVDLVPGLPDRPHSGPPQVPGPALARVQSRLLRGTGHVGHRAGRARAISVWPADDVAPVWPAVLPGRGRAAGRRRGDIRGE